MSPELEKAFHDQHVLTSVALFRPLTKEEGKELVAAQVTIREALTSDIVLSPESHDPTLIKDVEQELALQNMTGVQRLPKLLNRILVALRPHP